MARLAALIVMIAASLPPLMAQEDLWGHAIGSARKPNINATAEEVSLTPAQQQAVAKLLKSQKAPWTCDVDEPNGEWLEHLIYRSAPLSATRRVFLVEAGRGCARGGQGSNGAMWLIRFDGRDAVLLAGPQQEFDGSLFSVEPKISNGYRDVITGWYMGGGVTSLGYFRFDGTAYHLIGGATLHHDQRGMPTIVRR